MLNEKQNKLLEKLVSDEVLTEKVIRVCELMSIDLLPNVNERVRELVMLYAQAEEHISKYVKECNTLLANGDIEINEFYVNAISALLKIAEINDKRQIANEQWATQQAAIIEKQNKLAKKKK